MTYDYEDRGLCMEHYEVSPRMVGHCLRRFEHFGPHGDGDAPARESRPTHGPNALSGDSLDEEPDDL